MRGDNGRHTVLVVDDEPKNVQLLVDLLEARNYQVWSAADGEQGLRLAREKLPDVVLLDVMMPRLNGLEVCRRLKSEQKTAMIPVLLVTALDARQDRIAGISAGANDFITKPVDQADLILRVRNAAGLKRLHEQMAWQLKHLQELETARDTLTHMIVHDLRSPLTGLHGYLDLIRMSAQGDPGIMEDVDAAHAVVKRLTRMISDVLDVSRMESGQMPVAFKTTDLQTLLKAAVEGLGPPPSGIQVSYDLPGQPVEWSCDPDLITRVVANLVGNAFKFTPTNGRVRIGLEAESDRVRITVTDSGPGVPAEFRDKVFEKFGQAPLQVAGVRSTGLGLTFCKLAVEAHGGRIGLAAPDGGGARFWIELFRKDPNG
jgi:two-component system, sensor histidine kinase and response regulator